MSTTGTGAPSTGTYSVEFFDLQLRFAAKVTELSGLPLSETVGSHTNIYVRLAMGPRLDPTNPDWAKYTSSLATAHDPLALTYRLYLQRAHLPAGPQVSASVGCFSYAPFGQDRMRLHFDPGQQLSDSPLSLANRQLRTRELTTLLSQAVSLSPNVHVVGASWLYNLSAYRRLFPQPYLDRLKPIAPPYQRMPLWGQFLHRDRTVRTEPAQRFHSRLRTSMLLQELGSCFPLPVLSAAVPAAWLLEQFNSTRDDAG